MLAVPLTLPSPRGPRGEGRTADMAGLNWRGGAIAVVDTLKTFSKDSSDEYWETQDT